MAQAQLVRGPTIGFDSARERVGVVPIRVLIEELRATTGVRVSTVMLLVTRVADRELVQGAVPDDQEDTAVAVTFIIYELEAGWRTRHFLEPTKRKLDLFYRMPATALDGVEESVRYRVGNQVSPQTSEEITAMSVPAPAAAMPLRKLSFLETIVKNLVNFWTMMSSLKVEARCASSWFLFLHSFAIYMFIINNRDDDCSAQEGTLLRTNPARSSAASPREPLERSKPKSKVFKETRTDQLLVTPLRCQSARPTCKALPP